MDQEYYDYALKTTIKAVVPAGLIFTSLLLLGTPIWKAAAVFALVAVIHRVNIGRRFVEGVSLFAIVVAVTLWVEVLPSKEDALQKIAALRQLM